ncbi:hypothetical protein ACQCVE_13455 [Metabacillus sp. 113a]|uniref:hypothetical protein n=1 Tax=Metabacillus sp. 113a TaxID=3404706 RepID=UPI003CE8516C
MRKNIHFPEILFHNLDVQEIANNAGIFIGRNRQIHWNTSLESHCSGFGTVSGNHNELSSNTHLVLNSPIEKSHVKKDQYMVMEKFRTFNLIV